MCVQDWKFLDNFVEDFSVTTGALGTPKEALEASKDSVGYIYEYLNM
ncbi:11515_t:CDS:2 [Entrophospora sp. SA101]|nr:11515_t:CDS:2 [Entrophospora sp. SA101]